MSATRPVLLIAGPDRSAISGVSTHVDLLMRSSLAQQFELVHFQVGSEGRRESPRARLARLAFSPLLLALAILRHRAVLVHLNTSLNRNAFWRDLAYLVVARLCGTRVIYQVHGGDLPAVFFRQSPLSTRLLRTALMLPEVVVLLAQSELQAYRRFVPQARLLLIAHGVATPAAPERLPVPAQGRALTLLFMGRLAREKGLYEALHALRLAALTGVKARILIAGEGAEEAGLRRHVAELGLESSVTFCGGVAGAQKDALIASADAFLLPSYGEGLPYALLETMAAGLPAIATRVGAIPDIVVHGTHGLLVPCRNAAAIAEAIRLLADDERRARMAAACRARVRAGYSIERVVADFGRLYGELCGPATGNALWRS
jgi:glycosyltransferase involved in cell wall biosynthesis